MDIDSKVSLCVFIDLSRRILVDSFTSFHHLKLYGCLPSHCSPGLCAYRDSQQSARGLVRGSRKPEGDQALHERQRVSCQPYRACHVDIPSLVIPYIPSLVVQTSFYSSSCPVFWIFLFFFFLILNIFLHFGRCYQGTGFVSVE